MLAKKHGVKSKSRMKMRAFEAYLLDILPAFGMCRGYDQVGGARGRGSLDDIRAVWIKGVCVQMNVSIDKSWHGHWRVMNPIVSGVKGRDKIELAAIQSANGSMAYETAEAFGVMLASSCDPGQTKQRRGQS